MAFDKRIKKENPENGEKLEYRNRKQVKGRKQIDDYACDKQ